MRNSDLQKSLAAPLVSAALLLLALPAANLHAQLRVGGQGTYQSQLFGGAFGAGARLEVDLPFLFSGLMVSGTWDRFFPDCEECTFTDIGGEVLMAPQGLLYLGLGVGHRDFESAEAATRASEKAETDADAELSEWSYFFVAGIRLNSIPVVMPFLEFRQEFGSDALNEQIFSLGLMLNPVGRRTAPRAPGFP